MILTCPKCATRYQVEEGSIPPQGRTVRCSSCAATWRAEAPDHPLDLAPLLTVEAPPPEFPRPTADALPLRIRAKNRARLQTRQAVAAGAVWGVLGALLLAVIGAAVLFRVEVVGLWPRTAGAYAKVGLSVNPTGLAPENIQAGPGLKNGHAAVMVSGVLRNVETRPHDPAPLRISLLDKTGKTLVTQVVKVTPGKLQPGETRGFSAAFLDPPVDSANVQVEFALDLVGRHEEKPAQLAEAHAASLRGLVEPTLPPAPPPKAAEALPASSPYALPAAPEATTHHGHDG